MIHPIVSGALTVYMSVGSSAVARPPRIPEPFDTTMVERWVGPEHHRVRVHVVGDGPPTVVLVSGLGGGLDDWSRVIPGMARLARVIAYDRPGLGASDRGIGPRTAGRMAAELHQMLYELGVEHSVILCGHSLGGSVAQIYASRWPGDVSALLLVDPASEEFFRLAEANVPGYRERRAEQARRSRHWPAGIRAEYAALDSSMAETRRLAPLPPVPVIMLIAGRHGPPPGTSPDSLRNDPIESLWRRTHIHWVEEQQRGSYTLDERSGHYIQKDDPSLVVHALRTLIAAAVSPPTHERGHPVRP